MLRGFNCLSVLLLFFLTHCVAHPLFQTYDRNADGPNTSATLLAALVGAGLTSADPASGLACADDGDVWTAYSEPLGATWYDVAYGAGKYVGLGTGAGGGRPPAPG